MQINYETLEIAIRRGGDNQLHVSRETKQWLIDNRNVKRNERIQPTTKAA